MTSRQPAEAEHPPCTSKPTEQDKQTVGELQSRQPAIISQHSLQTRDVGLIVAKVKKLFLHLEHINSEIQLSQAKITFLQRSQ